MDGLSPEKKSPFESYVTELIGDIGVLNNSVNKLKSDLPSMLKQIADGANEVSRIQTAARKTTWVVCGGLAGMGFFAMGVSYGAIYSTWTNPVWINRDGLASVLSTALLKTPVGGVGFIVIALALVFLQKNLTDSVAKNETDEAFMKVMVYLSATMFVVVGFWLSFLMMFR